MTTTAIPTVRAGCPSPGCDATKIEPVDVFCESHEQFLPLSDEPGAVRVAVLLGWGAAICWMFLLSAQLHSAVPVFLAAASVGLAITALPLRRYPLPWFATVAGWIVLSIVALVSLTAHHGTWYRGFGTPLVVLTLAAWVVRFAPEAFDALRFLDDNEVGGVSATVAVLLAAAGAMLLVPAVTADPPLHAFRPLAGGLRTALPVIAAWTAGAALVIAAGTAALLGLSLAIDRSSRVVPLPRQPRRLRRPALRRRPPIHGRRDPFSLMARTLGRFAEQFAHAAALVLLALADAVIRVLYWLAVVFVGWVNWLIGWLVSLFLILRDAVRVFLSAAWVATRAVVIPTAGLVAGTWGTAAFARTALHYLTAGGWPQILPMLGYALSAAGSLTVVWLALCRLPLARSARSAVRSATVAGAWTLILIAIGGWVLGLLGMFGYGPVHIGPITLGSTAVLLSIGAVAILRDRVGSHGAPTHPVA